jgi:hypothetical protein
MLNKIAATERLDPRPQIICSTCNSPITMSWHPTTKQPFWVHNNKKCLIDATKGETLAHNFAKLLLVYSLSTGLKINLQQLCPSIPSKHYYLQPDQDVVAEWAYSKRAIFDVGCYGPNPDQQFAIEVFNTHKTDNIDSRLGVDWFEVDAYEVLNQLDQRHRPQEITLKNIRRLCHDVSCPYCMSFDDLITQLGLVTIKYEDIRGLRIEERTWKLNPIQDSDQKDSNEQLWQEFLQRRICACCTHKLQTTKYNPYCKTCLRKFESHGNGQTCTLVTQNTQELNTRAAVRRNKLLYNDNMIHSHLERLFDGNTAIPDYYIHKRIARSGETSALIESSSLHQLYLNATSARQPNVVKLSGKNSNSNLNSESNSITSTKISNLLRDKRYQNILHYVGHATINKKDYYGFHILESQWDKQPISVHSCTCKTECSHPSKDISLLEYLLDYA